MATLKAGIESCLPGCVSIDLKQESACHAGLVKAKSLTIDTLKNASQLFPFDSSTEHLCAARLREWITYG